MGLFDNNLKECESRCDTWFFTNPELADVCKSACKANKKLSKDDFLCSGNYISELDFYQRYGYDPCPKSGYTLAELSAIAKAQADAIKANQPPPPLPPPKPPVPPVIPPKNNKAEAEPPGYTTWIIYGVLGLVVIIGFVKLAGKR